MVFPGKRDHCLRCAHPSIAFYMCCRVLQLFVAVPFSCLVPGVTLFLASFASCCWQLSYLSPDSLQQHGRTRKEGGSIGQEFPEYIDTVYLISPVQYAPVTPLYVASICRGAKNKQYLAAISEASAIECLCTGRWLKADNSHTFVQCQHSAL